MSIKTVCSSRRAYFIRENIMAFALLGWEVVVSFKDNGGETVTRTYSVPDPAAEFDDVATAATALIATLDPLTDCLISSYAIKAIIDNDTQTLPAAGVQNENQMILTLQVLDKPRQPATVTIPSPVIGAFASPSGKGANIVVPTVTIVANFIGLFVAGGVFKLSDGDTALIAGAAGKR